MKTLFNIGIGIIVAIILLSSFGTCSRRAQYGDNYNVTVQQTIAQDAAAGLDLQAVGELVKKAKTGPEFEKLLNDPNAGINNLDLNEDGQVDYIKVTEYGSDDVKGFSLTVDLPDNQTQEVATIEIEKTNDGQALVQTHGNEQIYGYNNYYRSHVSLTDVLLISWLFSANRPFYSSPWHYGYYPTYYHPYSTRGYDAYRRDVRSATSGSNWTQARSSTLTSNPTSPNASKNATNIKAPLRNPTTAQKSFQARNPSKTVRSGGFGGGTRKTASPSIRTSGSSSYRSGGK